MKNFILAILFFVYSSASSDGLAMPDHHGPISVMGDHTHKKGEYMFSYRIMKMKMNSIYNGNKSMSIDSVMSSPNGASDNSGTYMNAPKSMKMDMHMFGMMYAPSDNVTLMLMSSYLEKEMTQQRMPMAGGSKFDVNSNGFGDTKLSALIGLKKSPDYDSHFGLGLSFPSGSIDKRDNTPVSESARLGYNMQNGSGTYDFNFLINNVLKFGKSRLGNQVSFKLPVSGKNRNDYRYDKDFNLTFWFSQRFIDFASGSLKLNYEYRGEIKGSDNQMNKRMSPAMDSRNYGFQKLNLGLGVNLVNHNNFLKNHRLGFEFLVPITQKFKGIQMADSYSLILGWQYGF